MSQVRYFAAVALALASMGLLSGCTSSQDAFTDLQADLGNRDELPQLADDAYDNVDISTSRFVGEHGDTSLWIAQGLEESGICIVADAGDDAWVVGCGGQTVKIDGVAGTFEVVPDGVIAPKGATQLSENVYAW